LDLSSPLLSLSGIGPVRSRALANAGFETVADLLTHLPLRYEDRRRILSVAEAVAAYRGAEEDEAGEPAGNSAAPRASAGTVTLRGRLERVRRVRLRRRGFSLVRGVLRDASGTLAVLWFNQPYLASNLDPEEEYLLHGALRTPRGAKDRSKAAPELVNPSCEPLERALRAGAVIPVYGALGPLGPTVARRLLARVLEALDPDDVPEPLPDELRSRHDLPRLGQALAALHRPCVQPGGASPSAAAGEVADGDGGLPADDVERLNRRQSPAHRRLIYGELLEQQLALAILRHERSTLCKARRYDDPARVARAREVARGALPFRLTGAQRRALEEIAVDLRRPEPMARLLQGDVGSGKTIVALLALVLALECGHQGAFMAPTELLAEQHHRRIVARLGDRYRVALLTGSNPDLPALREELAAGRIDLAVGTHALIQEDVRFRDLGLVVIDEQHRFGVLQRQLLEGKGDRPDVLVMTATPIPRTLALTAFGDLESSVLDEQPPGRSPVHTETLGPDDRPAVYARLAETLAAGERAYVVYPRIGMEGGEGGGESGGDGGDGVPSLGTDGETLAGEVARRLGSRWRADWTAVVHGRMDRAEREAAMARFADGRARLLLATTVIEVGVDVPEATGMVIEGADRFGLSQLHQLRGRVGRGRGRSWCVAVTGPGELTDDGRARLEAFRATTDGFEIAERDLEIRGFGDLLGIRQAGLARFRVADPVAHRDLLERAREDAHEVAPRMGEARFQGLARAVERALDHRRRLLDR